MAEIIQLGEPPIDVMLRRPARAKRLSLRISGVDGQVSLSVPPCAAMSEARAFLAEKEGWIRKHLGKQPALQPVRFGTELPVEGMPRAIVEGPGRVPRLLADRIELPAARGAEGAKVAALLKTMARDRLADASAQYAGRIGRSFGRITLRDTRSRWGSCTTEGNLMYSWRLILAPPEVLDYVAAHEVSHLAEMNHSKAFWDTVEGLMPGYATPRKWLRQHGGALHRYQF